MVLALTGLTTLPSENTLSREGVPAALRRHDCLSGEAITNPAASTNLLRYAIEAELQRPSTARVTATTELDDIESAMQAPERLARHLVMK